MLPLPAGKEASSGAGALEYERHRPERALLYQLVEEYYHAFKALLAAHGTELPEYVEQSDGAVRFRWVKAPTSAELADLAHSIAQRVGRFLERRGLLERDAENSYLSGQAMEAGPLDQLLAHSITYRIAVGPQAGRKVLTRPTCDELSD